ncbi:DUF2508 family protein [Chengkuizengella sediminis]|uniref:DUF2508 family protein n=1 Tax=Chengkuizengella sediminis TaxID=1885917 RepID=UPI00138A01F8|nr:DUF2508 family protein [Chengkuizengella sediminis]NDI36821.1 DUF2508 family protein [Chengkuizengella sediminis]
MTSLQQYLSKRSTNVVDNSVISIYEEIEQAKQDWIAAGKKFNYAVDKDEIDFAIFSLEAAEKRYEMLLRQAKELQITKLEEKKK